MNQTQKSYPHPDGPLVFIFFGLYYTSLFISVSIDFFNIGCLSLGNLGVMCEWNGALLFWALFLGGIYWLWLLWKRIQAKSLTRGQYLFMTSGFVLFFAPFQILSVLKSGCPLLGSLQPFHVCGPTGHVLTAAVLLLTLIWVRYLIIEIQDRFKRSL